MLFFFVCECVVASSNCLSSAGFSTPAVGIAIPAPVNAEVAGKNVSSQSAVIDTKEYYHIVCYDKQDSTSPDPIQYNKYRDY